MNWKEIRELNNNAVEFAAHSRTHPDLTKLNPEEAEREIIESKSIIEERLGVEVTDFAYPYGKYDSSVKQLTRRHFKSACSTRLGKVQSGDDPFSLKRVDAYYLSDKRIFNLILSLKFDWYLSFRQAMRDFRSALSYSKY